MPEPSDTSEFAPAVGVTGHNLRPSPHHLQSDLSRRLRGLVHDASCALPPLSYITGTIASELEKTPALGILLLRIDMLGNAAQLFTWSETAKVYDALARLVGSLIGTGLRRVDVPADLGVAGESVIIVLSAPREGSDLTQSDVELVAERLRHAVNAGFGDDLAPGIRERLVVETGYALLSRPAGGSTLEEELLRALSSADAVATAAQEHVVEEMGEELSAFLESDALEVEFQPIIELPRYSLAGFEAYVRGPEGSHLERGDVLLDIALRVGLSGRAYDVFHQKALERTDSLIAPDELLMLPVTAEDLLAAVRAVSRLYLLPGARLTPANIMFVVDSPSVFRRFASSMAAFESVSDMGFRLGIEASLDDPFPLDYVRALRPHLLRLRGRSVIGLRDHSDEFELVFTLTRFAARHDMKVQVVGCGDTRELEALRRAEVDLVQGDLFGDYSPVPNRCVNPAP